MFWGVIHELGLGPITWAGCFRPLYVSMLGHFFSHTDLDGTFMVPFKGCTMSITTNEEELSLLQIITCKSGYSTVYRILDPIDMIIRRVASDALFAL